LLLVGTRKQIPAPAPGQQFDSAMTFDRGKDSEKPDGFYTLIENMFPNLPKVELFARRKREGWDSMVNEVGDERE
jgi:N6-adenosine-specific RNA methylase IME4